ncbi:MAG TPA: cupredoxin domain-containing protein [Gammaproteobacteria bacterium]|nr:cupredoxin domain-containing protein [Gammaproteobacteria bacterium]
MRRKVLTGVPLAAAAVLLAGGSAYVATRPGAPGAKIVRIVAERFAYLPAHLTLRKNEPVILELTSRDVLMGFNLPDFDLRADMPPDRVVRVPFVPDKTGDFVFLCDVFCGDGHEQMQGTLTVVE